jgi:chemotaxis response regulator CheB
MKKLRSNESERLVRVVGIGASAGGLDAINQLLEGLSPDLGLAYLVVSHMDPRQESHLPTYWLSTAPFPSALRLDRRLSPTMCMSSRPMR